MNDEAVERDLKQSYNVVKEKIKPVVEKLLEGWELMAVESRKDEVSLMLDMSCGIDYLLYSEKSSLVLGVSSRVQYGENYQTFTVRKSRESGALTEYEKRNQAILHGGLYPYYSMQAYVKDGEVAGLGMAKTVDLIEYIKNGYAEEKETGHEKIGRAKFYVCRWDKMRYCGYKVYEYVGGEE